MNEMQKYAMSARLAKLQARIHPPEQRTIDPKSFAMGAGSATVGGTVGLLLAKLLSRGKGQTLNRYKPGLDSRDMYRDFSGVVMHHLRAHLERPPVIDI